MKGMPGLGGRRLRGWAVAIFAAALVTPAAGAGAAAPAGTVAAAAAAATSGSGPSRADRREFRGKVERLSRMQRKRMRPDAWRPGCPVPMRKLRSVTVSHWDFDGDVRQGRIVVHREYSGRILAVFRRLYAKRFRIRRIEPIERYGGSDHDSMAADNTSGFNCRQVAGTNRWSNHAYGKAIDLNPRENPYVTESGHVSPPEGAPYADRKPTRKGMIAKRGPVVRSFRRIAGWRWGGNWAGTRDYQHFSWDGR